MTIQEFAGQVIETLQAKFPEYFRDAEFQIQQVAKPGNLILTGIGIRMKNTPISPLYYIDSALQNGQSAEETAKEIANQIAKQSYGKSYVWPDRFWKDVYLGDITGRVRREDSDL